MDDLEIPFEKFRHFLYTGELEMDADEVPDMLLIAAHFQVSQAARLDHSVMGLSLCDDPKI